MLLELLPRSQIDVYVQVLQADGGTRCACINAAAMALADAGIPMRDALAAVAVGHLQATPLLDLNYMEDSGGGPDISVALQPNQDRLVLLQASILCKHCYVDGCMNGWIHGPRPCCPLMSRCMRAPPSEQLDDAFLLLLLLLLLARHMLFPGGPMSHHTANADGWPAAARGV